MNDYYFVRFVKRFLPIKEQWKIVAKIQILWTDEEFLSVVTLFLTFVTQNILNKVTSGETFHCKSVPCLLSFFRPKDRWHGRSPRKSNVRNKLEFTLFSLKTFNLWLGRDVHRLL